MHLRPPRSTRTDTLFPYPTLFRALTNNLGGSATTHDLTQTFAYNPAGQIASVARSNDAYAWQAHYNVDRSYLINGLNRIMNVGSTAFSYDGRGNLTNDGTNAFTYRHEERSVGTECVSTCSDRGWAYH